MKLLRTGLYTARYTATAVTALLAPMIGIILVLLVAEYFAALPNQTEETQGRFVWWALAIPMVLFALALWRTSRGFLKFRERANEPDQQPSAEEQGRVHGMLAMFTALLWSVHAVLVALYGIEIDSMSMTLAFADLMTKGMLLDLMETYHIDVGPELNATGFLQLYELVVRTLYSLALGAILLSSFRRAQTKVASVS